MAITETTPTTDAPRGGTLDEEVVVATGELTDVDKFEALVRRLSHQSVVKHYDAYDDIPWDDPEFAVDPTDPRWVLADFDTLGATDWYKAQPLEVQIQIGLYRYASAAKLGMEFENVLKRGLLEYTFYKVGNDDPRFRYVYHEVAEETHHGMMFQEFVNRTKTNPRGLNWFFRWRTKRVVSLGHHFPELFFFFVLGGEDPIDHVQRQVLRQGRELPPVFETIMRHHVTEEARHLSFARHYLKLNVPQLSRPRRVILSLMTPGILGVMARMMMMPPSDLQRRFAIPDEVMREAYQDNPQWRQSTIDAVQKVRKLCRELGLLNPLAVLVWKSFGVYAKD